jgi:hypothetical protein
MTMRRLLLLAALAALPACTALDQILAAGVTPPGVTFQGANLAEAPSQTSLAAYYCPRLLASSSPIPGGAQLLCRGFFGASPAPEAMRFAFDVRFQVSNPNQIPLPLAEILTAVTLFPSTNSQSLGAVCLRLCTPGDTACQAGATGTGCQRARGDISSLSDFAQAAANLLIAEGLSDAAGHPAPLVAPRVLAGSSLDVTTRFALAPSVLLPVMEELARQSVGELRSGRAPRFVIPYNLKGTVFADAGSLGRLAAGFGPTGGEWQVPTQALVR